MCASRLRERPNKNYVLEALAVLNSFSKAQRKKLNLARAEQQKRTAAAANKAQSNSTTSQAQGEASSSRSTTAPPLPSSRTTAPMLDSTASSSTSPPPPGMAPMLSPSNESPLSFGFPLVPSGNSPGIGSSSLPFPFSRSFSPVVGGMEDVD